MQKPLVWSLASRWLCSLRSSPRLWSPALPRTCRVVLFGPALTLLPADLPTSCLSFRTQVSVARFEPFPDHPRNSGCAPSPWPPRSERLGSRSYTRSHFRTPECFPVVHSPSRVTTEFSPNTPDWDFHLFSQCRGHLLLETGCAGTAGGGSGPRHGRWGRRASGDLQGEPRHSGRDTGSLRSR